MSQPPAANGWTTFGRLLVECGALEVSRGPRPGASLEADDVRLLLHRTELEPGPQPDDVRSAFAPPIRAAWESLVTGLDADVGLGRIARGSELSDVEVSVLALCGAVELDTALRALCAVAQDCAVAAVAVELVRRSLGPEAVAALAPSGRLVRAGLLEVDGDSVLDSSRVRVPRTVAWALAGTTGLAPDLPVGTETLAAPERGPVELPRRVLVSSADRLRRLANAAAGCHGRGFLVCPSATSNSEWQSLIRHASAYDLGIIIDVGSERELSATARQWIERADHLAWAVCSTEPISVSSLPVTQWTELEADSAGVRADEWQAVFGDEPLPVRPVSLDQLELAAMVRRAGEPAATAMRRVAAGTLGRHARAVQPRARWDDLVLPEALSVQLHDLVDRYRFRSRVHDDWGLPLTPSPGVVAMFSGPSGTGKSTASEIIAHELGIGMYRVDLSALVSKYIGETEKNLEELFSAAYSGDYLLLFDEADALFGTRSAVNDSKDRYANMEVSYLLQRLETYDGFVVLTSNFPGNIDQAFLRRVHVSVHFQEPSAQDRRRIWVKALGRAPQRDLDLDGIAARYDLTGGSIRNAALSAAFLAAAADRPINSEFVQRAVQHELTKLGRRSRD